MDKVEKRTWEEVRQESLELTIQNYFAELAEAKDDFVGVTKRFAMSAQLSYKEFLKAIKELN